MNDGSGVNQFWLQKETIAREKTNYISYPLLLIFYNPPSWSQPETKYTIFIFFKLFISLRKENAAMIKIHIN
jgi:hypothetical protein